MRDDPRSALVAMFEAVRAYLLSSGRAITAFEQVDALRRAMLGVNIGRARSPLVPAPA